MYSNQDGRFADDELHPSHERNHRFRGFGIRALLSLLAVGLCGTVAVVGTQAAFSDDVTMAQIKVTGGTLDMTANSSATKTGVAWSGDVSVALTGLKPGDVKTGTVEIDNTGDLPFTLTTSTSGTDAGGCFGYWLRETSVVSGSGASGQPISFTGLGTDDASDGTTAAFATGATDVALPDNGADVDWETDDTKQYTISVRMLSGCTTNGAEGTLDVSFHAAQV